MEANDVDEIITFGSIDETYETRVLEPDSLLMRLSFVMKKLSWTKTNSTTIGSPSKCNTSLLSTKSWKKLNFFRIIWNRVVTKRKSAKQNGTNSPKFTIVKTEDLEQLLAVCCEVMDYFQDRHEDKIQQYRSKMKLYVDEDTFTVWNPLEDDKEKLSEFKYAVDMCDEKSDSKKSKLAIENGILKTIEPASEKETEWTQVVWKTFKGNSAEEPRSVPYRNSEDQTIDADRNHLSAVSQSNREYTDFGALSEEIVVEILPSSASDQNFQLKSDTIDQQWQIDVDEYANFEKTPISEQKKDSESVEDCLQNKWRGSQSSVNFASESAGEIEKVSCCSCSCHNIESNFNESSLDLESLHLGTYQAPESPVFISRPWFDDDPSIFLDCSSLKLMAPNIVPINSPKSSSTLTDPISSSSMPCSSTFSLTVADCSKESEFPEDNLESQKITEDDSDETSSVKTNSHEVFGGLIRRFAEYLFNGVYSSLVKRFW